MVSALRRCAVWLVLLLLLPACTTGVLIADRDQGFQAPGERYVQLRLDTVRLEVVAGKPGEHTVPGALCLRSAPEARPSGPCRALQFKLPFLAWNGTDESWPVRLGMFTLERRRSAVIASADVLQAQNANDTVALLAPHSGAHFDVLVHVADVRDDEDPLQGDYLLIVRSDVGKGTVMLQQNLSVGSFSQLAQFLRFLGTATLLLAAAAAL